jgi:hypothetical protein
MPGAEVPVLEKMIVDGTLGLTDTYSVEWADRENPYLISPRIYVQLMFDTYGFTALYYVRLEDARTTFQINGTFTNILKHYDWSKISVSDSFAFYVQRPDVIVKPYKLNIGKRRNK